MGVSPRHTMRGRVLITRCSACGTEFRVTEAQLAARNGWVRCGKCMAVFDARRALVTPPAEVTLTPTRPASPHETDEAAPGNPATGLLNEHPQNLDISSGSGIDLLASSALEPEYDAPLRGLATSGVAPHTPSVEEEKPDEAIDAAPNPPPETESSPAAIVQDPEEPAAAVTSVTSRDEAPVPAPEPIQSEHAIPHPEGRSQSGNDAAAVSPVEAGAQPAPVGTRAAEPAREAAPIRAEPETAAADDPLVLDFGREPRKRRTALWIGGSAALLVALGAQAAFQYRGTIALLLPEAKPHLEELCATLGCELPLPRRAELLSIETSDLQGHPNNPGVMVLAATLRNRAPFPQAYPALELTLTDDRDQPLARRVLQPSDYLGQNAARPEARVFAPSSEQPIRVFLEASALKATSYRLYLFHP